MVFALEGYYDESGDFDDPASGIFVVSGYMITPTAARKMDSEWRKVLTRHDIPYFHMVDCAHEPPSGVFKGKDKLERSRIVKKLIGLIKTYTLEGISLIARASTYQGPRQGAQDIYSQFAAACVKGAHQWLEMTGRTGDVAYFFEDGHTKKSAAYNFIAAGIKRPGDSVSFAPKADISLLQSADLLAWQTAKYVKDYFYPFKIDGKKKERTPRKDFQSLMKHQHVFLHFDMAGNKELASIETWPMKHRAPVDLRFMTRG